MCDENSLRGSEFSICKHCKGKTGKTRVLGLIFRYCITGNLFLSSFTIFFLLCNYNIYYVFFLM